MRLSARRVSLGPEALQCATANLFTAFFEAAAKFEQHSCRILVPLYCKPIGSDIRRCRYWRLDANSRQDSLNQERARHERAIGQRNAITAREAIRADKILERLNVPYHLAGELLADSIVACRGGRLTGQGARLTSQHDRIVHNIY